MSQDLTANSTLPQYIGMILYIFGSTIRDHRYRQSLGDLFKNMVAIRMLRPLVDRATMHGDGLNTGRGELVAKLKSRLQIGQDAYLTSHRYRHSFNQLPQDAGRLLRLGEESSAHTAEYREFLGAAHINVDAGNVLFHHTGDLGCPCRI